MRRTVFSTSDQRHIGLLTTQTALHRSLAPHWCIQPFEKCVDTALT